MARDWGGNNLAIDLAPGPAGKWGQVILFGRDYDCKYVVARSWSAFLATVADDLNSGKWFVEDDTNELKLREFKTKNVEPGYLDILRWRADQKYGRKGPKRRSTAPMNGNGSGSPVGSPYSSPTAETGGEPRGRSMQRFSGASPVASPNRPNYGKPSPLARVAEENSTPIKVYTNGIPAEKLVEVETPKPITVEEVKKNETLESMLEPVTLDDSKENPPSSENIKGLGLTNGSAKKATVEEDTTMKTIEI